VSGPILEARSLSIGYPARAGGRERLVAAGLDFALSRGDFVCLLGANGAGKTTLLKTVAGMQPPLSGECRIAGKPVSRLGLEERAGLVALVLTEQPGGGWFSAYEIAAFGRYPYTDSRGRLSAEDRKAVLGALAAVGMEGFAARPFAELSDGEKRKILVARALAQDTPLLILDEPTVFLDAPSRLELFYLARRLAREAGKAVVLSTHDVELALAKADRLWLLGKGGSFAEGLPEELALSGKLGEALSTEAVRYDAESGGFRPAGASPQPAIALVLEAAAAPHGEAAAEDHALALWARRLVSRLGYRPAGPGAKTALRLRLFPAAAPGAEPRWRIEREGAEPREGSGLAALARALEAGQETVRKG